MRSHDFFIAYASPESRKAKQLCWYLEEEDCEVFLDKTGLQPGTPWPNRMREALAESRATVVSEPGCGKTDFAFAAASGLAPVGASPADRKPLEKYVRNDTRAQDLLYHYDAVRRFGDSQTGGEDGCRRAAMPQNYIVLEALGAALVSPVRKVVLIDEIDKAPKDLPNDLLRELDQGWFEIPEIPKRQQVDREAIEPP